MPAEELISLTAGKAIDMMGAGNREKKMWWKDVIIFEIGVYTYIMCRPQRLHGSRHWACYGDDI